MEKQLVNPYEKEFMKVAMLKHEQTFKEQVCELHRLYQIQKILMKNIESINGPNNGHSQERWINSKYGTTGGAKTHHEQTIIFSDGDLQQQQKKPQRKLDLERPAEEYIIEEVDCNGDGVVEIEEDGEGEIELTLGLTSYNRRRGEQQKLGDHHHHHQTPLTSDSGPSSSSSTGSTSHMKKTNINTRSGTQHQQRADRSTRSQWGGLVQNDHQKRNSGFEVEEPLRQERLKQPPWLLQALSLNMT